MNSVLSIKVAAFLAYVAVSTAIVVLAFGEMAPATLLMAAGAFG